MAVPKRKHSNSRTGKRRSHDKVSPIQMAYCPKCSERTRTHCVCGNCGYYMGRVVSPEVEAAPSSEPAAS